MATISGGLMLVGALTVIVGMAGFVDTRQVDRRYRTGYKYNAPDSRNFPRARRRLLYGIAMCIIGATANGLTESKGDPFPPSQSQGATAPQDRSLDAAPSEADKAGDDVATDQSRPRDDALSLAPRRRNAETDPAGPTIKDVDLLAHSTESRHEERVYSDNEIAQMEEEKQYRGDDPIVRRRLGLPSRDTRKLIP